MWLKCSKQRLGPTLADVARREIQVVVLEHDHGSPVVARLLENRVSKGVIDHAVTACPGLHEGVIDDRLIGQGVQLMLDEPQEGLATVL